MFRKYKFTHSGGSKVFFASDTHFRHKKVAEDRGFNSIEEHDEYYIRQWNNRVRGCDNVIFLGDFVVGAGHNSVEECEKLLTETNGHIWFLFGNHLAGIRSIFRATIEDQYGLDNVELYPITWQDKVTFVGHNMLAEIKQENEETYKVFCSHYAHRVWKGSHKGVLHASGHSHGTDPQSQEWWPVGKRLDCGVEIFGGPISFDAFLEIMNEKEVENLGARS